MRVIEHILSTIAPNECLHCGAEYDLLCPSCAGNLPTVPERCYRCLRASAGCLTCRGCRRQSVLHSVHTATTYNDVAKGLIHKLKFERAQAAAAPIAALMKTRCIPLDATIITHVPTATGRVRRRGYDQAELIAKQVAQQTGLPYTSLLTRLGQHRQVGKNKVERQAQMKELFFVTKRSAPKHVLLIDDVITTGATLEACARKLKEAGVGRISALVFAAA